MTTPPYGLWPSPFSVKELANMRRFNDVQWAADGTLLWVEGRGAQSLLVSQKGAEAPRDMFRDLSLRPGVGYGGGEFATGDGFTIFVANNRLYRQPLESGLPQPITPAFGGLASPAVSPDGQSVVFVHTYEDTDVLALAPTDGQQWPRIIARDADFYAQPAWHPQGRFLAWMEWDFPQMPWDGSRLMLAEREGNGFAAPRCLAGNEDVPVFQPAFSPDGRYLAYLAQDGDMDTLYLHDLASGETRPLVGGRVMMLPAWVQGLRAMAWLGSDRLLVLENRAGFARILLVSVPSGEITEIDPAPYAWLRNPAAAPDGRVAFLASSAQIPERVVVWRSESGQWEIRARAATESIPANRLPAPEPISWQAEDGTTVHALYYPPAPAKWRSDAPPPAIVSIHGGPTSQRTASFNAQAAYFATRGYAYVELNYRGSTGYGRNYMLMLQGRWGEVDVEDAVTLARVLGERGLADPQRLVIMGGSAGGYTVLNVLARHPGVYKAGIDLYGVSDLFTLDMDTHKFEKHYTATLVGSLPEAAEKYRAWSPLFHADKIRDPVAVFQGLEDKVVTPNQSESIVQTLRRNGVPHVYKTYAGEGHGFRKPETLEDMYATIEAFLQKYVLFA